METCLYGLSLGFSLIMPKEHLFYLDQHIEKGRFGSSKRQTMNFGDRYK